MFTTRMRDTAFKRSLKKVSLGTQVKIDPPTGSFTLHKNSAKAAVFLAGGIGITPFLSILRQADHDRLPHKLHLFYSNRRPEDAPFLDGLQMLEKSNPNFHLASTMSEMSKSNNEWKGETGLINQEMLSRHLINLQGPICYIAGPLAMVAGLRNMLVTANIGVTKHKMARPTPAPPIPDAGVARFSAHAVAPVSFWRQYFVNRY